MCNLLRKELRLAAHPSLYMFMAMGALVLIPAYPYGVVFFFGGLGVFQTVMFGRETRDVFYTALLPVPSWSSWRSPCPSPFCARCTSTRATRRALRPTPPTTASV